MKFLLKTSLSIVFAVYIKAEDIKIIYKNSSNENFSETEMSFLYRYWYIWFIILFMIFFTVLYIEMKKIKELKIIIEEKEIEINNQKKEKEKSIKQMELEKDISSKAMTAKNMLLRNMSHEIRTPMNSILSICDIIQLSNLSIEQKNYIEDIKLSANSLMMIISEIIEYSKLEAGERKIEINRFNLEELISNLLSSVFQSGYRKGLEIGYYISNDVPVNIKADKNKLSQILMTLVSNAVKYTEEGFIYVYISLKEKKDEKYYINFRVKDTGTGISENKSRDIFNMYGNVISSKYSYRGTGIGLPVAKNFIDIMGGDIDFKSSFEEGSEFEFCIPVEELKYEYIKSENTDIFKSKKVSFIYRNEINKKIINKLVEEKGMYFISKKNDLEIKINNEIIDILIYEKDKKEKIDEIESKLKDLNIDFNKILLMINPMEIVENKEIINLKYEYIIKPIKKYEFHKKIENMLSKDKMEHIVIENIEKNEKPLLLVVEDNEINRTTVIALLEKKGYELMEAKNGKEAVEIFEKNKNIKLILMDIQMPIMDGYEAAKIISESSKKNDRKINIIALTAYVTSKDKEKCFAAGMSDYISKPFNIVELYEKIKKNI